MILDPNYPSGAVTDPPLAVGEYVLRTLLISDMVDSTAIVRGIGDARAHSLFQRSDRLARDLLLAHNGIEIDKTDGFLLLFERPLDALLFSVAYHQGLAGLSAELEISLATRIGIHLGELHMFRSSPEDIARGAKPVEVEGLAKPFAARVMSVALGGQTLLTRGAFELCRRAAVGADWARGLSWVHHGRYLLKGVDEPVELFEVGRERESPLVPPPDSAKVTRLVEQTAQERQVPGLADVRTEKSGNLLSLVIGEAVNKLLQPAAERQVGQFFAGTIEQVKALGQMETVIVAMTRAWSVFAEMILDRIRVLCDVDPDELAADQEFASYAGAVTRLITDRAAGGELLRALILGKEDAPDPAVLGASWARIDGPEPPPGFRWKAVSDAFRKRLLKRRILSPELNDQLDARNLTTILTKQTTARPSSDEGLYRQEMFARYRLLDLDGMRPGLDQPEIALGPVFVPPLLREDPPPVPQPLALQRELIASGEPELSAWQIERAQEAYSSRRSEPILGLVTSETGRRLVLLGEPGSGKSTLIRFLFLSVLASQGDLASGPSPIWASGLADCLPLLVELDEYAAACAENRCTSFLTYWHHLGCQGFLDADWLDQRLRKGPSLVLLDGVDEVYGTHERRQVLHSIAEFAATYPQARVVVTSLALGYSESILRAAGFRHFAIMGFDDEQIASFLGSWFAQVLPGQPDQAEQLKARIIEGAARSQPIRQLAHSPMMLTIMALVLQLRELPQEHWALYSHAAEVLDHHWNLGRHLEEAGFSRPISREDKAQLLGNIAIRIEAEEGGLAGNMICDEALQREIAAYLGEYHGVSGAEARRIALQLIARLRGPKKLLCLRGPRLYGFLHRTLLEYHYATVLVRRLQKQPSYTIETVRDEVFAAHWQDPEWWGVLRLVSSLAGDQNLSTLAGYLISSAYPDWRTKIDDKPPANLVVALQCLAEAGKPHAVEQEALELVQAVVEVVEYPGRWKGSGLAKFIEQSLLPAARSYQLPDRAREWLESSFEGVFGRVASRHILGPFARLAAIWLNSSPTLLATLRDCAINDKSHDRRSAAIAALAEGWADDGQVRSLISLRASVDSHHEVQIAALQVLTRAWPEQAETFPQLAKRAHSDSHYGLRRAAVQSLAEGWPGHDEAHSILSRLAVSDPSISVRNAALAGLVHGWADHADTHSFLCRLAKDDAHHEVRGKALSLLGLGWPDDDQTRSFLRQRALADEHNEVRQAGLVALVRGTLDQQSLTLLSCDLDGQAPFLDPREPAAPLHIRQGAQLLGIDEKSASLLLASCEAILGWNPLLAAADPDPASLGGP